MRFAILLNASTRWATLIGKRVWLTDLAQSVITAANIQLVSDLRRSCP